MSDVMRVTNDRDLEILQLWAKKRSVAPIAIKMKMSRGGIYRILEKYGIKTPEQQLCSRPSRRVRTGRVAQHSVNGAPIAASNPIEVGDDAYLQMLIKTHGADYYLTHRIW